MEGKLIEKAQRGDRKALEKLLQDNYSILKGYNIKMTLNKTLAEDITQETMLKAIINIKKYKPSGKFSTWLITIATNVFRDQLRKDKKLILKDKDIELGSVDNVEESVMIQTDFQKLRVILKGLPEEKRMIFILKHYHGYSYEEISRIMGCPIGTVRSRLHYCIEKIRRQMEGGVGDE